jgi:hypothetical protein
MPEGTPYRGSELAVKKALWDQKAEARRVANKGLPTAPGAPPLTSGGYVVKEGDTAATIARYQLGGGASQAYIDWYANEIQAVLPAGRPSNTADSDTPTMSILTPGTRIFLPPVTGGKTVNGKFVPLGSAPQLRPPIDSGSLAKPKNAPSNATGPGQWLSKAGVGWVWMQWSDTRGWYDPRVDKSFINS